MGVLFPHAKKWMQSWVLMIHAHVKKRGGEGNWTQFPYYKFICQFVLKAIKFLVIIYLIII